jgi:uncharacterized protein YdhG (YjbR/CyaY superfamily)
MAGTTAASGSTKQPASSSKRTSAGAFSDAEKAAMKERARELKAAERKAVSDAEGERDVLTKIAEMPDADRTLAERIHAIVKANAPQLSPRTWYGMPAYTKGGKVVCFFKSADKFSSRYATVGFEEAANLDDGTMWATSYALTEMTAENEARIAALVKQAAS